MGDKLVALIANLSSPTRLWATVSLHRLTGSTICGIRKVL